MTGGMKIGAMILAGVLSCQGTETLVPVTESPAVIQETVAAEVPLSEMEIYPHWLPAHCFEPAPEGEKGTVQKDQVPGHQEFPHTFTVYLPPHYDENRKYDLLIFMGPSDGHPGDCIDGNFDTWYTDPFRFSDIYDQLLQRNLVRPFILVQPDYLNWQDCPVTYDDISQSIREEFLPYVADHYATYAENGTTEALTAARDHIAIGGASLGGMYIFRALLRDCADISSLFCPMSCQIDITKVQEEIETSCVEFPVRKLIYTYGGFEEPKLHGMGDYLKNVCPQAFHEDNVTILELEGTHHYYSTWAAGLWNSIQLLFRTE